MLSLFFRRENIEKFESVSEDDNSALTIDGSLLCYWFYIVSIEKVKPASKKMDPRSPLKAELEDFAR